MRVWTAALAALFLIACSSPGDGGSDAGFDDGEVDAGGDDDGEVDAGGDDGGEIDAGGDDGGEIDGSGDDGSGDDGGGLNTVRFSSGGVTVDENAGTLVVTVERQGDPTEALAVPWEVSGSATLGDDYSLLVEPLLIDAGSTSASFDVAILTDGLDEGLEDIVLTLVPSPDLAIGTPSIHRIRIASGNVLDDLEPGHWGRVPGSHLRDVMPDPLPPADSGAEGLLSSWNSGAYDTSRDKMMIWGGGHRDYGGNEVYTFDMNTLVWERTWGPSPDIPGTDQEGPFETLSDGNPASRHTYDGLEYLPGRDSLWITGGALWGGSSGGTSATWEFRLADQQWARLADNPEAQWSQRLGITSALDPVTGLLFVQLESDFVEYDPVADTFTWRGTVDGGLYNDRGNAAIDPIRRLWVQIGREDGPGAWTPPVHVWNLETFERSEPVTTGATVHLSNAPGFEWDPTIERLVAWDGGTAVYSLDTETWTFTEHPAAPTNVVTPVGTQGAAGIYGHFRYVPSKNLYVAVTSVTEDVFVYRLSP